MRSFIYASLALAGLAAAAPKAEPYKIVPIETKTMVTTLYSTPTAQAKPVKMYPIAHPDADLKDLKNLKATKDASMRYAESEEDKDQEVATISSEDPQYPMVQLEHSSFIKKLTCTDKSVSIQFGSKDAYKTAAEDWKTHEKFVIVSYDPTCGPQHDDTLRDYMLADKIDVDQDSLTIKADVSFVEFDEAFGQEATITCDVGRYAQKSQKRFLNPFGDTVSDSKSFSWNNYPTNDMTDSFGWGPGYQLLSDGTHTLGCVGCGTDGEITLTGTFTWSGFDIKEASVALEGHMKATLAIGIEASASGSLPIKDFDFPAIPIGGFSIGGVVTIGPQINIAAGADVDIDGDGGMLIGASLEWTDLKASADWADGGKSDSSNLAPTITPKNQFNGTMTATIDLHLPISIGIGVKVKSFWEKELKVEDRPGFSLKATNSDEDQCEGVDLDAGLYNDVNLDLFGIKTIPLMSSWTTNLFTSCFTTAQPTTAQPTTSVVPTTSSVPLSTGIPMSTGGTGTGGVIPTQTGGTSAPFPTNNGTTTAPPNMPSGTGASVGTLSTMASIDKRYFKPYY